MGAAGVASRVLLVALALGVAVAGRDVAGSQTEARVDVSVRAVVGRVTAYVDRYQRDVALLVADEDYVQDLYLAAVPSATRRMRGELFLTFLERERAWTAVHDIAEVDGRPVSDREDLWALLRSSPIESIARRLVDRNARFNLGTIRRNFNEPTFALQLLSASRVAGVRFEVASVDRTDAGAPIVTLTFRERARPTLVRRVDGQNIEARGTVVVEAATGRVRRTQLLLDDEVVVVTMDTVYALDAALDLWVPTSWAERYEAGGRRGETVIGQARYSNYRRFEVTGRVK